MTQRPDVRAALVAHATVVRDSGFPIAMVRIDWDLIKKKKRLAVPPPQQLPDGTQWHQLPSPDNAAIAAAVAGGANAYLYRLPEGWHVADTDGPESTARATELLGPPDVVTPRGAHWLLDGQVPRTPGIDTEPRQLYGPGSFYSSPAGLVTYSGAVPRQPRPLAPELQRPPEPPPPAPGDYLGGFFSSPPITRTQAMATMKLKLDAIADGPTGGAAARTGIMAAAFFAGGLLHTGWFGEEQAAEAIRDACARRWGRIDAADEKWIEQGLNDGERQPVAAREDPPGKVPGQVPDRIDPITGERVTGPRARLVSLAELHARGRPEPMVDGWIDRGALALLYGPGSSAKSFVALDMAASVAMGLPWHGSPTKKCDVIFIVGEGSGGFAGRTLAWCASNQVSPVELNQHLHAWEGPVDLVGLVDPDSLDDLCRLVAEMQIGLVVVDTVARCTPGADENSAKDVGVVVRSLDRIRDAGATVLVLHHTPKEGGGPRGSGALLWATDAAIAVGKERELVTITNERQKDRAEPEEPLHLALVGEPGSGSAYLTPSQVTIRPDSTRGAAALPPIPVYEPGGAVDEGDIPDRGEQGAPLDLMVSHIAQTLAAQGTTVGISRAEVAKALGRAHSDSTIRRAWGVLYDAGAIRPAVGQRQATGRSVWIPPGPERDAELTGRVLTAG
jgi:hypothetical protein